MRQAGEPSVEEILESIKKVIARDNRENALADRRRKEEASEARPAVSRTAPATRSAAEPSAEPSYDNPPQFDDEEVLELEQLASEILESAGSRTSASGGGLTNENAAAAMRQSLAALALLAEPSAPPQIVRSGETSLEGLVREMLRPMLSQWLDANLPQIVENHVKAEIARIAGKKR